ALSFVADGKPLSTIVRKPTPFQIAKMDARPQRNGTLSLELQFEPKSPVSWVAYVEKRPGEFEKVGAGDDTSTSAAIPGDAGDPAAAPSDIAVRVDATDGFALFTQTAK